MNPPRYTSVLVAATLLGLAGLLQAAIVPLTPADINSEDSATTSYSDGSLTLTPYQGSTPATFNGNAARLGIDDFGTNADAFNDPDTDPANGNEEKLEFVFAATAGLTQIAWDFSRADGPGPNDGVFISGFTSDPGATLTGGVANSSVSYSGGVVEIDLAGADFGNPDGFLNLANPAASAGQTLLLTVTDTTQAGAQLALTGISYEDALALSAPVITTGLDAAYSPVADTELTLSVTVDPTTFPAPTYNWEFDDGMGGGFVSVGTDVTYAFTAGSATDGTYRITVTNSQGSDSSTTVVTSTDDGDGIDNQWEIDNFGDHLLYDDTDDVEPDNFTNAQEIAAGTDPNDPDTDGDGINDGDEAANNTDPLDSDSDDDGYSDGYEVHTAVPATAPDDPNSTPGTDDARNSIGVKFGAANGANPSYDLPPAAFAGAPWYSQKNWNLTLFASPASGDTTQVGQPNAGVLVDSSGAATAATLSYTSNNKWSALSERQTPFGRLFAGYIDTAADDVGTPEREDQATVTVGSIPYSRYDIVVYFGSAANNRTGGISDGINNYTLTAAAVIPDGTEPEYLVTADSDFDWINEPPANYAVFRGHSSPSATVTYTRGSANAGIFAVQIVEDLDTDGDGMGDNYETSVGLNPSDDGSTDPVKEGATGDFDGDGIDNLTEHDQGTNPTDEDTDGDGFTDDVETDVGSWGDPGDTGTDPRIADWDGDGVLDGAETNTGVFNSATDAGTDPFSDDDSDFDGWADSYEVLNGPTSPFDATAPGGPNPAGFAIAFNSIAGTGNGPNVEFGPLVHAGAPGVEQKNWNRSIDLDNNSTDANGDIAKIDSPNNGEIVDSSGAVIGDGTTGVGLAFAAGHGAWSSAPDPDTPYGRLFNSFIFGRTDTDPNTTITLTGIPYSSYDVYVYFGSETNGRTGTLSSAAAGVTYSFTTTVNSGVPGTYMRTTDTGSGFPEANYAVFSSQSGGSFDVTSTVGAGQNTLGIYGVQVVDTSGAIDPYDTWAAANISDPGKRGETDDSDADGIDNLVEFALFTDPDDPAALPALGTGAAGADFELTYLRAKAATNVTYIAEWSINLVDWDTVGITDAPTGTEDADTAEFKATVAKGGDPAKFLRIRVTKP